MRRLAPGIFRGVPLTPAAERAVAATFADWRYEAARASHPIERVGIAVRSTIALVRVLMASAVRELRSEVRSPFLWRVGIGCALVIVTVGFVEPMFPRATGGAGSYVLASLAQGLYMGSVLFPLAMFAAEVTGRSTRRAPSLGSALVVTAAVAIWVMVVAPEALNLLWTIRQWGPVSELSPPVPSLVRWFTGEPTRQMSPLFLLNRGIAWVSFSLSLWGLAVLASQIRAFAAGSSGRRIAIVWGSVLIGAAAIPTVAILPRVTPLARVPYAWTLLILVLAFAAFWAAAAIARWTVGRGRARASAAEHASRS